MNTFTKIIKYAVAGVAAIIMFFAVMLVLGEETQEVEYSFQMFCWIKFSAGCTVYAMGKIIFRLFPIECESEEKSTEVNHINR